MGAKNLTERQLRRRNAILSSARELMESHGYGDLTMRDLAEHAGVAVQTLYDLYGSKDALLARALEERSRAVYENLDRGVEQTGVERLLIFAERECDHILTTPALARSLAPVFASSPGAFQTEEIYMKHHRRAMTQIRDAGELADWADINSLLHLMLLEAHGALVFWANGDISTERFKDFIKLNVCNVLAPVTSGHSRRVIEETQKQIYQRLEGWDFH